MPFKRAGKFTKGKRKGQKAYKGPSGRRFNIRQVRLYYASGGTFKKSRRRRRR